MFTEANPDKGTKTLIIVLIRNIAYMVYRS